MLATVGLWHIRLAIVWITSFILYMWWCFHEGVDPNHPFTLTPDQEPWLTLTMMAFFFLCGCLMNWYAVLIAWQLHQDRLEKKP